MSDTNIDLKEYDNNLFRKIKKSLNLLAEQKRNVTNNTSNIVSGFINRGIPLIDS